jgi:hypothetical protein
MSKVVKKASTRFLVIPGLKSDQNVRKGSGPVEKPEGSELQMQAKCFQWAWNTFPATRRLLFHVPNGGQRNIIEAGQLKASGVVAGVPDLVLVGPGKTYGLEAKVPGGRVSDAQRTVHDAWRMAGHEVHVFWSFEEFKLIFTKIIQSWSSETMRTA